MSRIFSEPGDTHSPTINRREVLDFFELRAQKVANLGPKRAVVYQDKHPDLAEKRDAAEKQLLLPTLALTGVERVLDLGCGTGRWTGIIAQSCAFYHGVDVSPGLIEVARNAFSRAKNVLFSVLAIDELSLERIGETEPFDVICCLGVLIYLNDDEFERTLKRIAEVATPRARILFREPLAIERRLTIKSHFSDEMEQFYNAIYRTENELMSGIRAHLVSHGFAIAHGGDVYVDASLNNRSETKQRWFLLER